MANPAIEKLTSQFVAQLGAAVTAEVIRAFAFPGSVPVWPKTKEDVALFNGPLPKPRKHTIQLCPSPGCKNPAAPVFGMVCGKHKDASKKTVATWRAARRARKARAS